MKKLLRITALVSGFATLFLVFFIALFPYNILKESLVQRLSENLGRTIDIDELSFQLPLTVRASGLEIRGQNGGIAGDEDTLRFKQVRAGLAIIPLAWGTIHPWVEIQGYPGGRLDVDLDLSIGSLISGATRPSKVSVIAQAFPLTSLLNYSLNYYASLPSANVMIAPMLSQLSFGGNLQSDISLSFPSENPQSFEGDIKVNILGFGFESRDPNLIIPKQNFNPAQIEASLSGGTLAIAETSQWTSDQLSAAVSGVVNLREDLMRSTMDLTIPLKMSGDILDQIGVLVQMALLGGQGEWDGAITLNLSGSLMQPQVASSEGVAGSAIASSQPTPQPDEASSPKETPPLSEGRTNGEDQQTQK